MGDHEQLLTRRVEDGGVQTEEVQRQGEDKGMHTMRFEMKRRDWARRVGRTVYLDEE